MSRKTTLILIGAVALLLIAGFLFYFFYWRARGDVSSPGTFPSGPDTELPEEEPTIVKDEGPATGAFKPILRQLSTVPVAGAVTGGKAGDIKVRYIERSTGNVLEIAATGGAEKRLTNTTIPKIYQAAWNKAGNGIILRYLKDDEETVESYSARIRSGTSGSEGELQGSFLPLNIDEIAVSPDGQEIFYLREEQTGSVGVRAGFAGTGRTEVWRSPLREWLALWPSTGTIALISKPSAIAPGVLMFLDRSGGERAVLSGIYGLTALPNSSLSRILYSRSTDDGIELLSHSPSARTSQQITITTFPEKCVWKDQETALCGVPKEIPGGSYPDSWYQGIVKFADAVWSVDALGNANELISDISEEGGGPIDLVSPQLSSDEKFLVFVNKPDQTLWSLQMTE